MRRCIVICVPVLLFVLLLLGGCGGRASGESYFNLPEGPKLLFRGGYGKITIKYTPPPDPIFRIANATQYIEFSTIKDNYGIPDKPIIVDYSVETSVMNPDIAQKTGNPGFDNYVMKSIQSWVYTRYGIGRVRLMVDVAKKKITVDKSGIVLIEAEKGRPAPKFGNPRDMVRAIGFTVVEGRL